MKDKSITRIKERRKSNKRKIVDLLGGSCSRCRYNNCLSALEFHHVSGEKEVGISRILTNSIENIKKELAKCVLLCSNCHQKEHSFIKEDPKEYRTNLRKFLYDNAGGVCSNCEETDSNCLEFHHINPNNKEFAISKAISHRWSVKKIIPEVKKCALLCRNCHREHHQGLNVNVKKINISEKDVMVFIDQFGNKKRCKFCLEYFKSISQTNNWCSETCEKEYLELNIVRGYYKKCNSCASDFGAYHMEIYNCEDCRNKTKKKDFETPRKKTNKKKFDIENICKQCDSKFFTTNKRKYCSKECMVKCYEKHSVEEIKQVFIDMKGNLTKTGDLLGISANSVKNRLLKYDKDFYEKNKKQKEMSNCKNCNRSISKYKKGNLVRYCSKKCKDESCIERVYNKKEIQKILNNCKGSAWKAHKILNIPYTTLRNWIKKNT